jgi:tetratricopeptide (TPR) repeat protein
MRQIFVTALLAAVAVHGAQKCSALQGQTYIDQGQYGQAINEFTCMIEGQPTEVEGYRGRIEAELLMGRFSDAVRDYTKVTALVLPIHPDAQKTIYDGYDARLRVSPTNLPALIGASFARWWFFDYAQAIQILNRLLDVAPNDVFGNLFRGSSRVLSRAHGASDLERAIALAPTSPDVRFIVADAFTYGQPDPERAFTEANRALSWGLNTPRIHAILGAAYVAFGNMPAAAVELKTHIDQVTTELVKTAPIQSATLPLVPGRTYEIPVTLRAGQPLSVTTSSRSFWDTILVLLGPDGSPVAGSDDAVKYFAALDWTAGTAGTYKIRVTSFESVSTGQLDVSVK